ncbi:metallopeptidase family protein [Falsirhodobacter algicola]|uniref:Neutral zinc metallopeptidase n=1 Tax=Falsirhodobacter algicola TaxID=2692330 RepID=A0A8J8MQH1_9RHOB|nr:metallopeptidase family protein [Falsirhodobacter algicola]QUS34805.1 neutral zinc metallopeptidase [Falsirhodobacter algicola]
MTDAPSDTAPDLGQIEMMAHEAIDALPPPWQAAARAVLLLVEDWPSDALLDEMEIDSPYDLTGVYDGVPLTQKSVMDQPHGPDVIRLFRRPILDEWIDRGNVTLRELVTHVTVHELAHHFGWSDDDIAAIDPWWE